MYPESFSWQTAHKQSALLPSLSLLLQLLLLLLELETTSLSLLEDDDN
jgi:hypothetical protein